MIKSGISSIQKDKVTNISSSIGHLQHKPLDKVDLKDITGIKVCDVRPQDVTFLVINNDIFLTAQSNLLYINNE
jgi:hypothetical protein